MPTPFHFAFNVTDLAAARAFYGGVLGCIEGRSTQSWVDFDFFGHQISLHVGTPFATAATGKVGAHMVAMPHFGVVLQLADWRALADRLLRAGVDDRVRRDLMGHSLNRERYGQGGGLAFKAEMLQRIAF